MILRRIGCGSTGGNRLALQFVDLGAALARQQIITSVLLVASATGFW
jgi:hypothetical protein